MTKAQRIQAGKVEAEAFRFFDSIPQSHQPLLTDCITDSTVDLNDFFWTDVKALYDQRLPKFLQLIQE